MSILQKQRSRDPEAGYARDFVALMREILPDCVEKDIKVLSNAGGVNVAGCAEAIRDAARELGLQGKVKIGVITGDDVLDKLDAWLAQGHRDRSTWTPASRSSAIRDKVQSANVYLGAEPLVEALDKGANIIVGGRLTDTGLTLAPLMHEFGWKFDDWDKVSAGTIAGHIIECGAQSQRRQLPVRLAKYSRHGKHRLSDRRGVARTAVHRHQTRRHRRPRQHPIGQRATSLRNGRPARHTSRPTSSPISRASTSNPPATTASRSSASQATRTPISTRSRSPTPTATNPSARSSTPGPTPTKKPRPPTRSSANASKNSASNSTSS